ncbi:MAG TPA: T9SS type A sorting domain-containing protein, partial [Candidatus Krumholzibacteria bacterium]|nr:T9SS type A sorting domain-containing protein [Candidatus Krumholzibacteria bacterium]
RNPGSSNDIYAQRLNAVGVVQWAANGVAVCNATGDQLNPSMISDGAGGAIIAWEDVRSGNSDVYTQRMNASGVMQWTANGVPIGSAFGNQSRPVLVADGAGGAIEAWVDSRGVDDDIYAEHINAAGSVLWIFPTLVCGATGSQGAPLITSDGASPGGAILTWADPRNGVDNDVYAQSVTAAGTVRWNSNGVLLRTAPNQQGPAGITSDGAKGAIVVWTDNQTGVADLYAQRVGPLGNMLWFYNGVAVCTASGIQSTVAISSDGVGGAIVTWDDYRSFFPRIYAQRVSAAGSMQWTADGVSPTTTTFQAGQFAPTVVSDGSGGAILTWEDNRSASSDIFTQRLEGRYSYWGHPEPILDVVKDNKNDQGGKVVLNWRPSGRDALNQQTIYLYSIWRALDVAPAQAMLASGNTSLVDTPSSKKANAKGHTLWIERSPATSYYWELIGAQVANYSDAYSFLASTRQDSVATDSPTTHFRIVAESYNQFINWPSNVLSGRSVDNLAPSAPLFVTAQRIGDWVHLKWNRVRVPDLKNYSVYRSTSSDVTPIPANFLATANDTVLVDMSAPSSAVYYTVTANDVHANQSAPSNEASVGTSTHVGNLPPIDQLTVLQNRPNPFAQETQLEVGLPSAGRITVDVYDVAGRRVRELATDGVKGWQGIALAGVDGRGAPLASGVYFYKIHAGGETLTRKMLITR